MLSVVIDADDRDEALARTLASLVGGALDGLVKEVLVIDAAQSQATARVAELSGCVYLPRTDVQNAVRRCRGSWILLLEPGACLVERWSEGVRAHIATQDKPARFRPSRWPSFIRMMTRKPFPALLLPKHRILESAVAGNSLKDGLARLKSKPLPIEVRIFKDSK